MSAAHFAKKRRIQQQRMANLKQFANSGATISPSKPPKEQKKPSDPVRQSVDMSHFTREQLRKWCQIVNPNKRGKSTGREVNGVCLFILFTNMINSKSSRSALGQKTFNQCVVAAAKTLGKSPATLRELFEAWTNSDKQKAPFLIRKKGMGGQHMVIKSVISLNT